MQDRLKPLGAAVVRQSKGGVNVTTYLTIITTVLVLTQVIRVTQNTISLMRHSDLVKREEKIIKLWDKMDAAIDKYLREGE